MKLQRSVSTIGLLFMSISSIMGSGWLFSSFYATENAGPAAIISWVLGGILMLIVAFTFAEVFSLLPVSGASVRIPQITHGTVVGVFCSLSFWFTYVVLISIEVQAVTQYLCFYFPNLMSAKGLTFYGYIISTILILIVCYINTISIDFVAKCNTLLTIIKIIIPCFIGLFLIFMLYICHNAHSHVSTTFMPYGWHGILGAISAGGIVFSYNGFKFSCEAGGETKNPGFAIPFAVIGSILICMVIFLILQGSFSLAITPNDLRNGWNNLTLLNNNSPFASLLAEHGVKWLIPVLYVGAVISPLAAGLIYCTCAARSLMAIALNGYAPKFLTKTNKRGVPYIPVWINFILAIIVFNFFNGWHQIADLLTYLFALTFVFGPVCLIALRKQLPERKRFVKLPFVNIWSFVSLYVCSLFIYWVGWEIISKTLWIMGLFAIIAFCVQASTKVSKSNILDAWLSSLWLWVYIVFTAIGSYMGTFGGGHGILTDTWVMIYMLVITFISLALSINLKRKPQEVQADCKLIE